MTSVWGGATATTTTTTATAVAAGAIVASGIVLRVARAEEYSAPGQGGEETVASWTLLIILTVLLLAIFTAYLLQLMRVHSVPQSLAVVFVGMIIGAMTRLVGGGGGVGVNVGGASSASASASASSASASSVSDNALLSFDPEVFFLFLLPPIIFESGYSLQKVAFFRNIGSILLFAVVGTFLSTMVIGVGLWALALAGLSRPLTLLDALVFGSLISSVDPVATLAIFASIKVDPTLHMLVFGESMLNDAVAIVLFRTFLQYSEDDFDLSSLYDIVRDFLALSIGSIAIGVAAALAAALLFKHTKLYAHPAYELSVLLIFCWSPYLLAEGLQYSGIMAIMFCGVLMAHYTQYNLSPLTRVTAHEVFHTLAFIAETCVFAYLGMSVFHFHHKFDGPFIFVALLFVLLGRAANIFPLSAMINCTRARPLKWQHQFVMWFSGLRGAVSFALALNVPKESRAVFVTTTLTIVLFTLIVLGGGTAPLLHYLARRQQLADLADGTATAHPSDTEDDDVDVDAAVDAAEHGGSNATAATAATGGTGGVGGGGGGGVGGGAASSTTAASAASKSSSASTDVTVTVDAGAGAGASAGSASAAATAVAAATTTTPAAAAATSASVSGVGGGLGWVERFDQQVLQPIFRTPLDVESLSIGCRGQVGNTGLRVQRATPTASSLGGSGSGSGSGSSNGSGGSGHRARPTHGSQQHHQQPLHHSSGDNDLHHRLAPTATDTD